MALTCHALTVGYDGHPLCAATSLTFAPGFHALVGRNGTGKSTFLKSLAHLTPPLSGEVQWQGTALSSLDVLARARIVSWLSAEETTPFAYAVEDILLMGRHPWHGGRPTEDDRAEARQVLAALDMTGLAGRRIDHLSTGERQLVRLGRALMSKAPVWLWDEPLRSLDWHHQIMVLRLLRTAAAGGKTILVALHELEWALRTADDFLIFGLPEGLLGPLSPEAFAAPALWREAFLVATSRRPGAGRPILDIENIF